jgi:hypothetical protein
MAKIVLSGSANKKVDVLEVRLASGEKEAFKDAADLAGIPLSSWVRERLRRVARVELEEAGRKIAFLRGMESLLSGLDISPN